MLTDSKCPECGQQFTPQCVELFGKVLFTQKFCNACAEALAAAEDTRVREEAEKARSERNEARWGAICPPLYRDTDVSRLCQDALKQVLQWQWSERGLVLHGESGAGKTRIIYQLLLRLFNEGRGIRILTASEFRRSYAAAAMEGDGDGWIERIGGVEVLVLDDLGQMKMTDAAEEALMETLEIRIRNLRPTFFTTQYVGQELIEQFLRPQRGQAILRRIREFCDPIAVKLPKLKAA